MAQCTRLELVKCPTHIYSFDSEALEEWLKDNWKWE